jgi:hypothetical protein
VTTLVTTRGLSLRSILGNLVTRKEKRPVELFSLIPLTVVVGTLAGVGLAGPSLWQHGGDP